ncbi:hypothetical protein BAE44_0006855 [Dichanthelium oligosanthes]|uniref:Uncharacterized protein n=1 Tax=Dichanthelium oligosanthes TaxID=888268 RepID=A0A1E5W4C0_9POAL|nr:hypothetical protein BAE44_0006855 [Dichanthelium oligosanthes]
MTPRPEATARPRRPPTPAPAGPSAPRSGSPPTTPPRCPVCTSTGPMCCRDTYAFPIDFFVYSAFSSPPSLHRLPACFVGGVSTPDEDISSRTSAGSSEACLRTTWASCATAVTASSGGGFHHQLRPGGRALPAAPPWLGEEEH